MIKNLDKQNIIDFLKSPEIKEKFDKYMINSLYLFGSYARGEQKKGSELIMLILLQKGLLILD